MVKVFVNASWNSRKHVCYDSHEDIFFELDDLRELTVEYDEVYLDSSIFSNMWVQLKSSIQDGRRVYYFARSWEVED
mgnify:CR=1 FL=1